MSREITTGRNADRVLTAQLQCLPQVTGDQLRRLGDRARLGGIGSIRHDVTVHRIERIIANQARADNGWSSRATMAATPSCVPSGGT